MSGLQKTVENTA